MSTPDGRRLLLGPVEAQFAIDLMMPAFERLANARIANKPHIYVVLLDATMPYDPDAIDAAVIGEGSMGSMWARDYREIARKKAELSWRLKISSREAQEELMFLQQGDCRYGGAVYKRGLVVAASGVQAFFDEWFATVVANTALALARFQYEGATTGSTPFLQLPAPIPGID